MNAVLGFVGVFDANAIIGLAKGECLDLSRRLFVAAYAPPRVVVEVRDPWATDALHRALTEWLREVVPSAEAVARAGCSLVPAADSDALALCLDHPLPTSSPATAG